MPHLVLFFSGAEIPAKRWCRKRDSNPRPHHYESDVKLFAGVSDCGRLRTSRNRPGCRRRRGTTVRSVFRAAQRKITILLRIGLSWHSGVYHVLLRRNNVAPSTEFRSCAWRLAFEVSSVGAWSAIVGPVSTHTFFPDGLRHVRKTLCRSALQGIAATGRRLEATDSSPGAGLRRKRAAPIARIAACHASAEESIRFTCTGSP
jgi:hypothetical protein